MRIKIIEEENRFDLERSLNRELASVVSPDNIFDIKYCGTTNIAPYSSNHYSAMIIYNL